MHSIMRVGRYTGVELEIMAVADYELACEVMMSMPISKAFMYVVVSP